MFLITPVAEELLNTSVSIPAGPLVVSGTSSAKMTEPRNILPTEIERSDSSLTLVMALSIVILFVFESIERILAFFATMLLSGSSSEFLTNIPTEILLTFCNSKIALLCDLTIVTLEKLAIWENSSTERFSIFLSKTILLLLASMLDILVLRGIRLVLGGS